MVTALRVFSLGLATFRLTVALEGVVDGEEEVESMMAMLTAEGSTLIGILRLMVIIS